MQMFLEPSEGRKRLEFGKRGRVKGTERKLTAIGSLRKACSRWWAKKRFKKTKGTKKVFRQLPQRRA
jgi:hypothetical protein